MPKLLLLAAVALCLPGCCVNTVVSKAKSPDGRCTAVLFTRDCGATVAVSNHVSVKRGPEWPGRHGNVFVANSGGGLAQSAEAGGPSVDMRWFGANRLLIRYERGAGVFRRETHHRGVAVLFEVADPHGGPSGQR